MGGYSLGYQFWIWMTTLWEATLWEATLWEATLWATNFGSGIVHAYRLEAVYRTLKRDRCLGNKQKAWIRRWRKRFAVRYRAMPARDDLAVDELRDKVRQGRDFAGRGLRKNGARGPKKS